jgi:hypothetical protein
MRSGARFAAGCVAGVALALGTTTLMAVPENAAARASSACWNAHLTRTDPRGFSYHVYYCYNIAPTPVWYTAFGTPQVGTLESDPSWFACKIDDGEFNGETNGPHPRRWLWTKADTPAGTWGWVPDDQIYSETDPVPNC